MYHQSIQENGRDASLVIVARALIDYKLGMSKCLLKIPYVVGFDVFHL